MSDFLAHEVSCYCARGEQPRRANASQRSARLRGSAAPGRSLLPKLNDVGRDVFRCVRAVSSPQEPWSNIPTLAAVRDDGNGLSIVAGQHTEQDWMAFRLKGDSISDLELEHLAVRTHLVQEPQALNNPVVQVDEFRLGELVDVDAHVRSHPRQGFLHSAASSIPAAERPR